MEGRFVGDFAGHARPLIAHSKGPARCVAEWSEVTYVDSGGEAVLIWFKEIGVSFRADSACSVDVCSHLQLPLVSEHSRSPHHSPGSARTHSHRGIAATSPDSITQKTNE